MEPGHTALKDNLRPGWWAVAPQRIGKTVGGADLTGSNRKRSEYHPVAWADLADAPLEAKLAKEP